MIFPKDSLIKMIRLITDLAVHGISCLWQIPGSTSSTTPSLTPFLTTSNTTSFDCKVNIPTTIQQKEMEVIVISMRRKCLIRLSAIALLSSLANTNNYRDFIISDCVSALISSAENSQSNR